MRGRAVERGRFFDLLAGCRISECHGRSVLTRKLWHSTQGNRAANEVAPQFTSRTAWWVSCSFLTRSLLVRSDSRRRVMSHTAFEVLKGIGDTTNYVVGSAEQ